LLGTTTDSDFAKPKKTAVAGIDQELPVSTGESDRTETNRWEVPMSAMPSSTQPEVFKGSLPVKKLVEVLAIDPANLKNDQLESGRVRLGKRVPLLLAAIMFCIGVAATLAWQSYSDAARRAIAGSLSKLSWLAPRAAPVAQNTPDISTPAAWAAPSPDQQQLDAMSLDLDAVRQSVDRIATSITIGQEQMTRTVDRITASQDQMARTIGQLTTGQEQLTRTVGQFTAGQEQLTREITKLHAIEQYILYKNSEPLAPKPVPRPSQARTAR
jgi:hypothetical protein